MSEEKSKNRKVEWSFSFENIGDSISKAIESVGLSGDTEVKESHFEEVLGDATSANIKLDMSIGTAIVRAMGAESDNLLLQADVTHVGEVELEVKSNGTQKSVRLGQKVRGGVVLKSIKDVFSSNKEELRWDVRLSPRVPLNLEVNTGVTGTTLDLTNLQLTNLRINSGTGSTELTLPHITSHYPVTYQGGTGECEIQIPANSDIDLKASNGTGETRITIGEGSAIDANISGGLGQCTIEVPAGAAVRLKGSTGLGSIDVPSHFTRLKGGQDFISTSGTWETPGYDTAARKITIKYSGGVGQLSVVAVGTPVI